MNFIITGSGAAESGKGNTREAARAKRRVAARRSRKQPINLKPGLTVAYVSTNEILYFVFCEGFEFVNDPSTNLYFYATVLFEGVGLFT